MERQLLTRQKGKTSITQDDDIESGRDVSAIKDANPITTDPGDTSVREVEYDTIESKGELIAGGASGLVERLPSGDVIKSPWPGLRGATCRNDMVIENRIYEKLGPHTCLIKVINWDAEACVLTMEFMPNGCLQDYLRANNSEIAMSQRLRWVQEAAEGLQLLHSANVIHCDVETKNFLLDTNLRLKIADFSGSSLEGSRPSACAGTRFLPPDFNWRRPPTIQQDLFSFGSTIYNIMTGERPFQELRSDEVEILYKGHEFPDVKGIPCGEIIRRCWCYEISSAQEVYDYIQGKQMVVN